MALNFKGQSIKTIGGLTTTVDQGWLHLIMAGQVPGHTYVRVNGHSHGVGLVDQELSALNELGFGFWPTAAAGAVLVSDDAADAAAGTGARSVIVRGLDANWDQVTATIVPTGLTPTAATAQTFIRINEVEVIDSGLRTAGTNGEVRSNKGTLTVSIGGKDIMEVYPNHSTSDAGRYTVPAGYEGHFQNLEGSSRGNKALTYHIFCRDNTVSNAAFQLRASWHSLDGGFRPNGLLTIFTEKTDIIFIVHAELAGAATSGSFEGWIEEM